MQKGLGSRLRFFGSGNLKMFGGNGEGLDVGFAGLAYMQRHEMGGWGFL